MTEQHMSGENQVKRQSFWICSGPLFETTLFIIPSVPINPETGEYLITEKVSPFSLSLSIFDADGRAVSDSQISISRFGPVALELEHWMESVKTEGGFRHGTLVVEGQVGWHAELRLHSIKSATFMSPQIPFSNASGTFVPISLSPERSHLIVLSNPGKEETNVRCRFYLTKRNPEHSVSIPARGSRVVGVEAAFAEYLDELGVESQQSYLRLTTRCESEIGVQIIERTASKRETGIFGAIG